MQVRLQLQDVEIKRLGGGHLGQAEMTNQSLMGPALTNQNMQRADSSKGEGKLVYQRRHELCKPSTDRDKCCRVNISPHLPVTINRLSRC